MSTFELMSSRWRTLSVALAVLCWGAAAGGQESPGRLTLSVTPEALVLGRHRAATVVIEAVGEGAERLEDLQLDCSIGQMSSPRRSSEGRWTASYRPPPGNAPRVALIFARAQVDGHAVFGALQIALQGSAELLFRTDPGARVSIAVLERTFGPEVAGPDGIARIHVEVPPGIDSGVARSVDAIGNQSEREIPLNLPPYQRTLISAPRRLVAGEPATVGVFSIAPDRTVYDDAELTLSRGGATRRGRSGDVVIFEVRAPTQVGDGEVELAAHPPNEPDNGATRRVAVIPGPARGIALTADREALIPGTEARAKVRAVVVDRYDNVRPGDAVRLEVEGELIETREVPEGGIAAVIEAPPATEGVGEVEIVARARGMERRLSLRLVGGPAQLARIDAPERAVADGRTPVRIRVLLTGPTGLPSEEMPSVRAGDGRLEEPEREPDGWWSVAYVPERATLVSGRSVEVEVSRGPAHARARIRLERPVPWLTLSLVGGVQTNFGALTSGVGRLELASRVRLSRGWIEIALFSGLGFGEVSDETERGSSTLRLWQVPLSAGFGYGLLVHPRVSLDLSVRGGALILMIEESSSFQRSAERVVVAPLVEGTLGITLGLWRGELALRLGFSYASGPEGSGVSGNLLGLVVLFGYRLFLV